MPFSQPLKPGGNGPWLLLILDRDPADPKWLLATVADPSHVLPDAGLAADEAAAWAGQVTGVPVILHLASAVVWRVETARAADGGASR
jgi:hypothetical protein